MQSPGDPRAGSPRRPDQGLDGRGLAAARRETLHRRARRIRRSVATLAVALFAAAFLAVYVQLASGHDPALNASAKRHAGSSSSTGASGASSSATTAEGSSGSEASSSTEPYAGSGSAESSEPSSVTTSQS